MKTCAFVAARMGSSRVPGKVLKSIGPYAMLEWVVRALKQAHTIDEIWVATTTEDRDTAVAALARSLNVQVFRGSENDVLDRFYQCAELAEPDFIVRITGDCPFIDPRVVDEVVHLQRKTQASYATNIYPPTYPDGLDTEVFTRLALSTAWEHANRPSDRDTVTQYIYRNRYQFPHANLTCPLDLGNERWVVDTEGDLKFADEISKFIGPGTAYSTIFHILEQHPAIRELNRRWTRNERFFQQLSDEPRESTRTFSGSRQALETALAVMPYGAGTYSKSHVAFGKRNGPLYLEHGFEGRVFDIDGNDYVDLTGGLLTAVLGHQDPVVNAAVRKALGNGISFGLAHPLEFQLAAKFAQWFPAAEMTMFCKNGSDALTAACRISRAHTGRNEIVTFDGGYHGWHDWALGLDLDRSFGVPVTTGSRRYNNFSDLYIDRDARPAAVILEPEQFHVDHIEHLANWCRDKGTLLVFDENITGVRWPELSWHKNHGITPDLVCLGKGLANGMPLAAICGRRDVMKRFAPGKEPNAFFSGTFFGEILSLAACDATLTTCIEKDVPHALIEKGRWLTQQIKNNEDIFNIKGHGLRRLEFRSPQLGAAFHHHMAVAGVLIYKYLGMMHAHRDSDLQRAANAFEYAIKQIKAGDIDYEPPNLNVMRR